MDPLPQLVLYGRAGCHLCDEARTTVRLVLDDRRSRGLPTPDMVERDIDADPELQRRFFDRIPVIELGQQRVELFVSVGKLRRVIADVLGDPVRA